MFEEELLYLHKSFAVLVLGQELDEDAHRSQYKQLGLRKNTWKLSREIEFNRWSTYLSTVMESVRRESHTTMSIHMDLQMILERRNPRVESLDEKKSRPSLDAELTSHIG